jgi:hypothetical protein
MTRHAHLSYPAVNAIGYCFPAGPVYIFQVPASPSMTALALYPCQLWGLLRVAEAVLLSVTGSMTPQATGFRLLAALIQAGERLGVATLPPLLVLLRMAGGTFFGSHIAAGIRAGEGIWTNHYRQGFPLSGGALAGMGCQEAKKYEAADSPDRYRRPLT